MVQELECDHHYHFSGSNNFIYNDYSIISFVSASLDVIRIHSSKRHFFNIMNAYDMSLKHLNIEL